MSDYYGESEKSYQTSIWMLHAILDGAGEDGRSDAIEDDDREILNKRKSGSQFLFMHPAKAIEPSASLQSLI